MRDRPVIACRLVAPTLLNLCQLLADFNKKHAVDHIHVSSNALLTWRRKRALLRNSKL
ncbi:unnamed protein product [Protopolystoma xenopodis]|uniref:Uncharacterized protein n=1 Tax=Protopolystoma xenopodis TaxID=117903 RepID=A0A448X7M2_9PLAT|nr:unnamed protein product [Protopolystoma xenopodis]